MWNKKSLYVGKESERLEQLRKEMDTVQATPIAREADLAGEKLELQKLKDELVAGGSRGGAAMEVDPNSDDGNSRKGSWNCCAPVLVTQPRKWLSAPMCLWNSRKYNVPLKRGRRRNSAVGSTAASREISGVVSWKVAGTTASLLSSFLSTLSFHSPWSVLCLQEAFTKTEGILLPVWTALMKISSCLFTEGGEEELASPSSCERHVPEQLCFNWVGTDLGRCVV